MGHALCEFIRKQTLKFSFDVKPCHLVSGFDFRDFFVSGLFPLACMCELLNIAPLKHVLPNFIAGAQAGCGQ